MVFSIFSGFIMPYPTMPVYWQWLNRISPTTWMLYGLGASQLGNVEVRAGQGCMKQAGQACRRAGQAATGSQVHAVTVWCGSCR
jgi:hypothetical protein